MYSIRISEQILTKNEKIGWEIFEIFTFYTSLRYRALNFPIFLTINLVFTVTFEQIKLEMPDWSHLKDLFKIFKTVTNFLSIP